MTGKSRPSDAILGESPQIRNLRAQIERLVAFDAPGNPHVPTVLLLGETGTGKGLVARAMHDSGPRGRGPFVDVNCAAIPEAMLEAELFGFEAGAFTDAKRSKPGLFESASAGTLFLDEVDSLSRPVQGKVLKAIEEKRVRRLGAVTAHDVDVKLVAATQKDLRVLVAAGEFRADLYHRLAVLLVEIPHLRDRGDDVTHLAQHFLAEYAGAHGLAPKCLDDGGREWLLAYNWPGNVRELGHLMERVTLLTTADVVGRETLVALSGNPTVAASPPAAPKPAALAATEIEEEARLRAALARAGGNVVRAARLLGIGRNALRYRMRRFGIARSEVDRLDDAIPPAGAPAESAVPASMETAAASSWEQKPAVVLAVSIAFSDVGERSSYDPWTEATRWERVIAEKIEGFGGVFAERSPSRFTAVFGVPRALEQTAQRAVQAALAIQRAAAGTGGMCPDLRTAVHAGEVRVDAGAADPLARLFPIADAFALAERLLGHAGVGEVLVSAPLARRVERFFHLTTRSVQLGPCETDRLTAHAVLRQVSLAEPSRADPLLSPFVGREPEVGVLLDGFARAAAGSGHVVLVAGEAGLGKSRLLAEFRHRLGDQPHNWLEGRCASYGTTTPFLPLSDALRRYLGVDDRDDEASVAGKVEREVERLGHDLAWTVPFLKQLLSLDVDDDAARALDAASRRSELFRAMRGLTLRAAELQPIVLVIEDLHWIDPASEEYLIFLDDIVPTARVLVLLSHRTGYVQPFRDRSYHLRVALAPLAGTDVARMTGSILGSAEMPAELRALIAGRAEGNPFFVEELARSLLEDGALRRENGRIVLARALDDISVPDTIQDVLIARIDRLAEESRRAIQVASVIGREFALRLLARITQAGDRIQNQVDELRGLELIYEKALYPELAYMFKHALTHDVAYESVVVDRRKALHRGIGGVIEELYADRLPEHYETLAHHYGRGEDWEKALHYHDCSAAKAAEAHANRAVVEHSRAALAIAAHLGTRVPDEVRQHLNERIGRACFYLSEFVASAAAYEEAAARCKDPEQRALDLSLAGYSHFYGHRYDAAHRDIEAALSYSRQHRLPGGEAMALAVRGFYRGVHDHDLEGFERDEEEALRVCAQHPNDFVEGLARVHLMMVAEWSGDYETARSRAEASIALGRKLRLPDLIIVPSWFLGKVLCCTGEYGRAITLLEEARAQCERIGDRAWKTRMLNTLGWCFAEIGATERARHYNEQAAVVAREIGDPEILANADVNLAMNHLHLGHLDLALAHLEPIEAAVQRAADPWLLWRYIMHVRHARGLIELHRGEPEKALAAADEELARSRRFNSPKIEGRAQILRAASLLRIEDRAAADDALRQALSIFARIGYRRGGWQAHRLLGETARRAGDPSAAREHAARAQAGVEQAARSLADDELRRCLLASARESTA